jgi:sporulation protein YlmC with PRC-barrel domain
MASSLRLLRLQEALFNPEVKMLRIVHQLYGYTIQAKNGRIGKIFDFFFDDKSWTIRYLIIDTQQWLPGGKVLISPVALGKPQWDKEFLPVDLSKEEIKSSPLIDTDQPVSHQMEERLTKHFSWPAYWATIDATDKTAAAAIIEAQKVGEHKTRELPGMEMSGNPHLRSTQEVTKYKIQALDEEVGHVEDFVIDDNSWKIRYLVVDNRNWLPGGKKVIVETHYIKNVDWAKARVYVDLTSEQVKESPEFNPEMPQTSEV